jgi:hypothetical protein
MLDQVASTFSLVSRYCHERRTGGMYLEIERRFLATGDVRRFCLVGERIIQGYIDAAGLLKIRIWMMGSKGFLTIKGSRIGCTRQRVARMHKIVTGRIQPIQRVSLQMTLRRSLD